MFHTNYQPELSDQSYLQYWIDSHQNFIDRFGPHYQTKIALENYREPSPSLLLTLKKYLNDYKFVICFDLYYILRYSNLDCNQWLRQITPDIIHLRDGINHIETALGQGKINWDSLLPDLHQLTETVMIIELSDYQAVYESIKFLEQAELL